jgi:hypothetical protein
VVGCVAAAASNIAAEFVPGEEELEECARCRSGDEGRRCRERPLLMTPRFGELFLSDSLRSGSRTDTLVGDVGNASSTGFLGARIRLGEPEGLCGRACGA